MHWIEAEHLKRSWEFTHVCLSVCVRLRVTVSVSVNVCVRVCVCLTGAWHLVELIAAGKNMTMRVDGGTARTIINDGERQFMELEEPLYLGGLPASVRDSAKKKYHVRNADSFNGKRRRLMCSTSFRQIGSKRRGK